MTKTQSEKTVKTANSHHEKDTADKVHNGSIQHRKQKEIIELFGKFPADTNYDYKRGRCWRCLARLNSIT